MKNQYSYRNVLEPASETILDHALKSQAKNLKATNLQGITYHHELQNLHTCLSVSATVNKFNATWWYDV